MTCAVCGAGPLRALPGPRDTLYHVCSRCGHTIIDPSLHPGPEAARSRYLLHTNGPGDRGYVDYLSGFLGRAVVPHLEPGSRILDFGSGPWPVLPGLLRAAGYRVDIFDPLFSPDPSYRENLYAAVVLLEVIEHIAEPYRILSGLLGNLGDGGLLVIRTQPRPAADTEFLRWWYREDPTHVSFFTRKSLSVLASRLGGSLIRRDEAKGEFVLRLHIP